MAKSRFQISPGDLELINYVYRYRLLQIDQLRHLTGRSLDRLYRRLAWLSSGRPGYLYRLKHSPYQKAHYLIGPRSLDLLVGQGIAPREILSKRLRHHELTELFLRHLRMISDVHLELELTTRRPDSALKLTTWEQGLRIVETVRVGKGSERQKLPFTPDAYFLLESKQPTSAHPWLYFVEADRSTTNHKRFSRKLEAYAAYFQQGRHRERYNVPGFRVLTFTLTQARAQNLAELTRSTLPPDTRRLFYFAALPDFTLATLFISTPWLPRQPFLPALPGPNVLEPFVRSRHAAPRDQHTP